MWLVDFMACFMTLPDPSRFDVCFLITGSIFLISLLCSCWGIGRSTMSSADLATCHIARGVDDTSR